MAGIDSYTKLCLHMDGDQSDSNHTITINGTPKLNSTTKKFEASSMYFDGIGDYLTVPSSGDWNLGTGDFTIDFWINWTTVPSTGLNGLFGTYVYHEFGWTCFYRATGGSADNVIEIWENDNSLVSAQWTPIVDTWYHIAVVRDGNTMRFFVDGVAKGTDDATGAVYDNAGNPFALASSRASEWWNGFDGFIDEFRITKGEARWTEAFTPPTSAYTSDANTKLLLHFDGDESDSAHETTFHGSPKMNAATTKFNGAYYFDGSSYLSVPDSDDWAFGSDDFTIDFWVKTTSGNVHVLNHRSNVGPYPGWVFMLGGSGNFSFYTNNNSLIFISDEVYNDDVWHHIALTSDGIKFRLFKDGVLDKEVSSVSVQGSDEVLAVAARTSGDYLYTGYLDELRISKGTVRWTENFDVPTEAYTSGAATAFKVKGTKSETARIMVFDESDWSIEYNTVVSGSDAYEIETADTGDRTVLARASDGEIVGYGGITPIEE